MRKFRPAALFGACTALMLTTGLAVGAEGPTLQAQIHVDRQHEPASPYEYGMFIEPIGSLVARTLWAEMLDDRKFYFPVVDAAHDPELPTGVERLPAMPLRKWRPLGDAAAGTMAADHPYVGETAVAISLYGPHARVVGPRGMRPGT